MDAETPSASQFRFNARRKKCMRKYFRNPSGYKNKSKDGKNSRDDLQDLGIRRSLRPQQKGKKIFLLPAPHTLSKKEKEIICHVLFMLKV